MNHEQKPKSAATKGEGSRYGGHPSKRQMPIMSGNPNIRHDNLNQSDVRASQRYGRCQGNKGAVRKRTKAVAYFLSKQTGTSKQMPHLSMESNILEEWWERIMKREDAILARKTI